MKLWKCSLFCQGWNIKQKFSIHNGLYACKKFDLQFIFYFLGYDQNMKDYYDGLDDHFSNSWHTGPNTYPDSGSYPGMGNPDNMEGNGRFSGSQGSRGGGTNSRPGWQGSTSGNGNNMGTNGMRTGSGGMNQGQGWGTNSGSWSNQGQGWGTNAGTWSNQGQHWDANSGTASNWGQTGGANAGNRQGHTWGAAASSRPGMNTNSALEQIFAQQGGLLDFLSDPDREHLEEQIEKVESLLDEDPESWPSHRPGANMGPWDQNHGGHWPSNWPHLSHSNRTQWNESWWNSSWWDEEWDPWQEWLDLGEDLCYDYLTITGLGMFLLYNR